MTRARDPESLLRRLEGRKRAAEARQKAMQLKNRDRGNAWLRIAEKCDRLADALDQLAAKK